MRKHGPQDDLLVETCWEEDGFIRAELDALNTVFVSHQGGCKTAFDPVPNLDFLIFWASNHLLGVTGDQKLEDVVGVHSSHVGNDWTIKHRVHDHSLVVFSSGEDIEAVLSNHQQFVRVFSVLSRSQVEGSLPWLFVFLGQVDNIEGLIVVNINIPQ